MKFSEQELNKRIRYVVGLSKEISWYVRKYKELQIDPDSIKIPRDLLKAYEKGLYTERGDLPYLRTSYDVFRQCYVTSGTSGKTPAMVDATPDDMDRDRRQCQKMYGIFISKSDRILNCFPSSPAVSGNASTAGLEALSPKLFHVPAQTLRDTNAFLGFFKMFDCNVVFGLTTSVYRLPLRLLEKGIEPKTLEIEKIQTGGEPSSVERRKRIGEDFGLAKVFDCYASVENMVMGYEKESFSNAYEVTLPETLLFLTDKNQEIMEGEVGDVVLSNLYEVGEKPGMILLNYKIGDSAKCLERNENVVTCIGDVRRESAYLAGAKLNPIEVENIIEALKSDSAHMDGEYALINYHDPKTRKAILKVRVCVSSKTSTDKREEISRMIEGKIYEASVEVRTAVQGMGDAELLVEAVNEEELYKDYEQYIRPGKPKRLLNLTDV